VAAAYDSNLAAAPAGHHRRPLKGLSDGTYTSWDDAPESMPFKYLQNKKAPKNSGLIQVPNLEGKPG